MKLQSYTMTTESTLKVGPGATPDQPAKSGQYNPSLGAMDMAGWSGVVLGHRNPEPNRRRVLELP